jgi:glycosyltransferase involved in cell wall biosynthesis
LIRLAFFGGADRDYPRSRVLEEGLQSLGVSYGDARVERSRSWPGRWSALSRKLKSLETSPRWLLIPEFAHKDLPLAWALARRHGYRVAFDPLVSRYDTLVEDWQLYRKGTFEALWNRWIDSWSFSHTDLLACDTAAHGERFRELGAPRSRLVRVPLGAERVYWEAGGERLERSQGKRNHEPLEVLYVGGFLPFHGVPVIVEAARQTARRDSSRVRWTLVGDGVEYERVKAELATSPVSNLTLAGRKPASDLPRLLLGADVSLGCFGSRPKTERVVPHKVVQSLAAGVCVVTARTRAMEESFRSGVDYLGVPAGDADALAAAVRELAIDPERRVRVARAGHLRAREERTPEAVARTWLAALAASEDARKSGRPREARRSPELPRRGAA